MTWEYSAGVEEMTETRRWSKGNGSGDDRRGVKREIEQSDLENDGESE